MPSNMLLKQVVSAFALLLPSVASKEMPVNELLSEQMYQSGIVHESIMAMKMATWEQERAAGLMESYLYPELGYTECINGFAEAIVGDANNTFRCRNTDLYHFLPHAALGSDVGEGSSSWGWTSDTGREFVCLGQEDAAAFVEITAEGKMLYLGRLPAFSVNSIWREIRGYKNFMIIGSEAIGHGVQIFDMKKLLDIDPASPVTFDNVVGSGLTGFFNDLPVGRTHNVVVNEEKNYAVAVGAAPRNSTCRAGLIFIDLTDPTNPTSPGCDPQDGYVHDAQCLPYRGPDVKYQGRDICYGYNEDTLTIYDVTDQTNTSIISRLTYEGARYTHQGWVLDTENQEFLLLDDELDEVNELGPAASGFPITYIWDIRSLENPLQTGIYRHADRGIDHNLYIKDGLSYASHYGSGLRVLDVSSIPSDPTGAGVCEAAFFDIYPEDDTLPGGGAVEFVGTWSSYAMFKSGYIFINTIERGAFVVKMTSTTCPSAPVCNADNCLRAFRASSIGGRLEESQAFCGPFTRTLVTDVSALPDYAASACVGETIARASSACACLPTATPPF